jgi:hypothetical protein
LSRAEWLKYFGALTNREAAANQVYEGIKNRYIAAKQNATNAASSSSNVSPKPVALFVDNGYYKEFSLASYKLNLLTDAGCTAFLPASKQLGDNHRFSNLSELHAALIAAAPDAIIDESYFFPPQVPTLDDVLNNLGINGTEGSDDWLALPFLRKKAVFRYDGLLTQTSGYDWLESGVALADSVLNDMIRVCQPTALPSGFAHRWFRNVANGELVTRVKQECENGDVQAPLIAPGQSRPTGATECPNWLRDPTAAATVPDVSLLSSTGSYETQQQSSAMKNVKMNTAGMKWISVGMVVTFIIAPMMMM